MKKLIVAIILISAVSISAQAQELGLRFGDSYGGFDENISIDGTLPFGKSRLHADLNLGNALGVDVLWDFFVKPISDVQGLHWYVGAGGSTIIDDNIFFLGGAGEIGLEYKFDFPMSLGLDYRPTYWIVDEGLDLGFENYFGLNVRYRFKK